MQSDSTNPGRHDDGLTLTEALDRLGDAWVAGDTARGDRILAEINGHAQAEHPHLAWDEQAAVFTTGQFEGRTR